MIKPTIYNLLSTRTQQGFGDNIAIAAPYRSALSYNNLLHHCQLVVAQLNYLGLKRGDRVAVALANGPEMAVTFLAITSCVTCAPLNSNYREREFDFYLSDLDAKALIVQPGIAEPARVVARAKGIPILELCPQLDAAAGLFAFDGLDIEPDAVTSSVWAESGDIALILHTSGTTSRPKMVPLTHRNLCTSAQNIVKALALTAEDRCLNVMPLFHIHGLMGVLLSSISVGGSVVCTPGFQTANFFDWLQEFSPTWYSAVPTIHQTILAGAKANQTVIEKHNLRLIRSSSASLPPKVMSELEEIFNVPVIESYGMTEASHQMASNPLPPQIRKPGSVGIAAGPKVAIMDDAGNFLPTGQVGEIVIQGENVTQGYVSNPEANAKAFTHGWFRTGDQGLLDEVGYLFIKGRIKELINRGGEKIAPREIDEVLLEHPAIAQSLAFAMPHPQLGEEVAAAVVLREGESVSESVIQTFVAEFLADFKVPRRIVFLDKIPKGPTGKLQRIGLAEKLGVSLTESNQANYVAPQNELELQLTKIWEEVLGIQPIGVKDNFFELGGHSLSVTQVVSRLREALQVELPLRSLFELPTVTELAERIKMLHANLNNASSSLPLQPVPRDNHLPLSSAQQRLWFLDQLEPFSSAYNIPYAYRFQGQLNVTALKQSLREIVQRHETLRTTFATINGQPIQVIATDGNLTLPIVDLLDIPETEREAEAWRRATEEAQRPFDLAQGPLLRLELLRLATEKYLLVVNMHHIISDGWSRGVFKQELAALYQAFCHGKPSPLPELPLQYADFAQWQQQWLQSEEFKSQLNYWKQKLAGIPSLLELPTDRPRPPVQTYSGSRHPLEISPKLTEAIKTLSQQEGVTLFMTLLAAFKVLLFRYSGQENMVVSSPIAGRNQSEIEKLIGFFVNTLALRTDFSDNPSFRSLLTQVREVALEAYDHQDLPFDKLVEELQPERDPSYSPIAQVMFVLQNTTIPTQQLPGLTLSSMEVENSTSKFDLTLELQETVGGLQGWFEYNTDLFEATTIERMAGHFQTLLESIVANPEESIAQLPLLTEVERNQLLVEWNNTQVDYPQDKCIHQLFEAQVERSPDAVAVVFEDQQLTYKELNSRANQLAHHLRTLGVKPEVLVAICVERSLGMVVGLLAILKAGGAYVPLDPAYPPERIAFSISDSQVKILLTKEKHLDELPEHQAKVVCLDRDWQSIAGYSSENPQTEVKPANLAYVIYTSGSTGKPKGVLVAHFNVVRLFTATQDWYNFDHNDVWTLFHSHAFDFSVWEIWGALIYGGKLVVVPYVVSRSPNAFYQLLEKEQVTVLNQTPSAFLQLIQVEESTNIEPKLNLRYVIFGGEALEIQSLKPWFNRHGDRTPQLVNMYGITETTVHVTYRPITMADLEQRRSVIGFPIPDLKLYLVDSYLQAVPIGVVGEMYVGGAGVARGYLNRKELTKERFINNPFSNDPESKLYKSGDLARYSSNGELEYLGRIDHQVKIRGFRIELGEIEALLVSHSDIDQTIAIAREDRPGDKRIVAYVISKPHKVLDVKAIRQYLQEHLPDYMVPSAFVFLDVLPLTPNGKVDRRALPAPNQTKRELEEDFVAPQDEVELQLTKIWEEVLGIQPIGVKENFFELGGHSLSVTQVVSRLREAFQVELPLRDLFELPTVVELAERIKMLRWATQDLQAASSSVVVEMEEIEL
ncbi:MAG: amino acid adenylation domain-containing protein [Coleofasciculaceae cyanobacterium]